MGEDKYKMFKLKNREFTYTVDDSQLDCGLNGALYFVAMDQDGGASKYGNAGAKLELGNMDLAAQRSTSGRQTKSPWLTPCTRARWTRRHGVKVQIAVTTDLIASRVCVTKMDATSILTALVRRSSGDLDRILL